jgi:hypothetical protein
VRVDAANYTIEVEGHLDDDWPIWPAELAVRYTAAGTTLLAGPFCDQAALVTLLGRLQQRGVTLLSLQRETLFQSEV